MSPSPAAFAVLRFLARPRAYGWVYPPTPPMRGGRGPDRPGRPAWIQRRVADPKLAGVFTADKDGIDYDLTGWREVRDAGLVDQAGSVLRINDAGRALAGFSSASASDAKDAWRERCLLHCGDAGDPPCWELDRRAGVEPTPCDECREPPGNTTRVNAPPPAQGALL